MGYTARAILTLVIFAIVMWLYGLGVKATVVPLSDWLGAQLGDWFSLLPVAAFFLAIGLPSIVISHRASKARRSDRSF